MSTIFVITQMKRFITTNLPVRPRVDGWRPLRLTSKLDEAEKFDTHKEADDFAIANNLHGYGVMPLIYGKGAVA